MRALFARPSYLAVSTFVLGVSIAAQLLIVAVVDGVLVRPPTARAGGELGFVRSSLPSGILSYGDYIDLRDRNNFFSGTFAYDRPNSVGVSMGDQFSIEECSAVSGGYFNILGVEAQKGRVFTEAEDIKGGPYIAVISQSLASRFHLEVGGTLRLNQKSFEVIGILPARFCNIDRSAQSDIWIPMHNVDSYRPSWILDNRDVQWVRAAGRLKPGASRTMADAQALVIGRRLQKENPQTNRGMDLSVDSYFSFRLAQDGTAKIMLLVLAVVWLLFLLAFSNFSALTLLRLFNRRREIAIRLAIGERISHIGRWILGDLAMVLVISATVGFCLAEGLLKILRIVPGLQSLLAGAEVEIDFRAGLVVVAASLGCGLVVWLFALKFAHRVDLLSAIKESASAPRRQFALGGLLAVQFAIAFALLTIGVAFLGGLKSVAERKLPLKDRNLLVVDLNLRVLGLAGQTEHVTSLINSVLASVREVPGVDVAAVASVAPLAVPSWTNLIVDGKDPSFERDKNLAALIGVTPNFHESAGLRLRRGRPINESDITQGAEVAVISQAAAERFWPDTDPIGRTFRHNHNGTLFTIVGVCDDIPVGAGKKSPPQILLPFNRVAYPVYTIYIGVTNTSIEMKKSVAEAIHTVWPYISFSSVHTIDDEVKASFADLAATVRVLLWVTLLAVIVAAAGMYFFSAHTASQTLRDAAIRLALGSSAAGIVLVHIARYRAAVTAGLVLGGCLLIFASTQLANISNSTVAIGLGAVVKAAAAMMVITLIGLCMPLKRLLAVDLYRILTRTAD